MIIANNLPAVNAGRWLGVNNRKSMKSLEKLSSGYRINSASDDAAGIAISESMRARITGLMRAAENTKDGVSFVQTAEGALSEVHSMLNRMVELSEQSANGILDAGDRALLQLEFDELKEEIDRISKATNFNGIKMFDGSLSLGMKAVTGTAGDWNHTLPIGESTVIGDGTAAGIGSVSVATAGNKTLAGDDDGVINFSKTCTAGVYRAEFINGGQSYVGTFTSESNSVSLTGSVHGDTISIGLTPGEVANALTGGYDTVSMAVKVEAFKSAGLSGAGVAGEIISNNNIVDPDYLRINSGVVDGQQASVSVPNPEVDDMTNMLPFIYNISGPPPKDFFHVANDRVNFMGFENDGMEMSFIDDKLILRFENLDNKMHLSIKNLVVNGSEIPWEFGLWFGGVDHDDPLMFRETIGVSEDNAIRLRMYSDNSLLRSYLALEGNFIEVEIKNPEKLGTWDTYFNSIALDLTSPNTTITDYNVKGGASEYLLDAVTGISLSPGTVLNTDSIGSLTVTYLSDGTYSAGYGAKDENGKEVLLYGGISKNSNATKMVLKNDNGETMTVHLRNFDNYISHPSIWDYAKVRGTVVYDLFQSRTILPDTNQENLSVKIENNNGVYNVSTTCTVEGVSHNLTGVLNGKKIYLSNADNTGKITLDISNQAFIKNFISQDGDSYVFGASIDENLNLVIGDGIAVTRSNNIYSADSSLLKDVVITGSEDMLPAGDNSSFSFKLEESLSGWQKISIIEKGPGVERVWTCEDHDLLMALWTGRDVVLTGSEPGQGSISISGLDEMDIPYFSHGDTLSINLNLTMPENASITASGDVVGVKRSSSNGGNGSHSGLAELGLSASVESYGSFSMLSNGDVLNMSVEQKDGKYVATANVGCLNAALELSLEDIKNKKSLLFDFGGGNKLEFKIDDPGKFLYEKGLLQNVEFLPGPGLFSFENAYVGRSSSKPMQFFVGDTNDSFNKIKVDIPEMSTQTLGLAHKNLASQSLKSQNSAGEALEVIHTSINQVSTLRGRLGALQNRLEHTLENLNNSNTNLTEAESTIRDADMAKEMMGYLKMNIISQFTQSMLAQAGNLPQNVLALLQ